MYLRFFLKLYLKIVFGITVGLAMEFAFLGWQKGMIFAAIATPIASFVMAAVGLIQEIYKKDSDGR